MSIRKEIRTPTESIWVLTNKQHRLFFVFYYFSLNLLRRYSWRHLVMGTRVSQLAISCSLVCLPVARLGCIQLSYWLKGYFRSSHLTLLLRQRISFHKIASPLLRTTSIQLNEHRDSSWSCYLPILVSLVWEGYLKRNVNTNGDTKLVTYHLSSLHNVLGKWWHRTCRNSQGMSHLT